MLPSAQTELTQLYQQNRWLDITDKPNADELVTLALGRIKVDPSQYDLFVAMLQGITGMENITHKVTSGESLKCTMKHLPRASAAQPNSPSFYSITVPLCNLICQ